MSGGLSLELYLGTVLHDGLAAIAHFHAAGGVDIDKIAETAREQVLRALLEQSQGEAQAEAEDFAAEQAALTEGLLRGFYRVAWPALMAQAPRILATEQEMTYDHDGLRFMAKPDLVLLSEDGQLATYVEYKSTSSKKESWVNSWATAVQLHSTVKAIQATLGIEVQQIIVQGLYKGYESYGKQSSPFCYAYKRSGTPPFSTDQISYEYKAGFKRSGVWNLPGGVKKWVEDMPDNILVDQFPQTPPIFVNEALVASFFNQRAAREKEIDLAVQMMDGADEETTQQVLDIAFEQHFDECVPYFGRPCAFRKICHGRVANPLAEGFIERVPHHQPELEAWQEEANGQQRLGAETDPLSGSGGPPVEVAAGS